MNFYNSAQASAQIGFKIPKNVTDENSVIVLLAPDQVDKMNSSTLSEMPDSRYFYFLQVVDGPRIVQSDGYFEGIMWPFEMPGTGIWSICIFNDNFSQNCTKNSVCDNFSDLGCTNITINDAGY